MNSPCRLTTGKRFVLKNQHFDLFFITSAVFLFANSFVLFLVLLFPSLFLFWFTLFFFLWKGELHAFIFSCINIQAMSFPPITVLIVFHRFLSVMVLLTVCFRNSAILVCISPFQWELFSTELLNFQGEEPFTFITLLFISGYIALWSDKVFTIPTLWNFLELTSDQFLWEDGVLLSEFEIWSTRCLFFKLR